MDGFWTSFGRVLDGFWTGLGRVLDGFWTSFGRVLDGFWTSFGRVYDVFWTSLGRVALRLYRLTPLDHYKNYLNQVMRIFVETTFDQSSTLRDQFGNFCSL